MPGGNRAQITPLNLDAIEKAALHTGTYPGALITTAVAVPIVASIISAIAFVVHWPLGASLPDWLALFIGTPLLLGTVPILIIWLLLAFILRRFTAVDRMSMTSYGELLNHLSSLDAQLSSSGLEPGEMKQVLDCRDAIRTKLGKKSLAWVTATGYINLWKEMHGAEAALIGIMPPQVIIAGALNDELRIQDSKIDTGAELLRKLRIAVPILDPSAAVYLQSLPPITQGEATTLSPDKVTDDIKRQARLVLREVRQALNDFRDDRWEAIVRARNQFVCTTIFTGLIMYVLLQFAILAGTPPIAMISATAFYLVGALVGLFSRLLNESQTSKSIDDYRLALVRLAAIPLYSGLAAVGGVLVVQKVTSLANIFDPANLLSGLIIAAGFGLTPNLLINVLQKQTEQYKVDLKSTAATQTSGAKTP
jgi:hypothetical protein